MNQKQNTTFVVVSGEDEIIGKGKNGGWQGGYMAWRTHTVTCHSFLTFVGEKRQKPREHYKRSGTWSSVSLSLLPPLSWIRHDMNTQKQWPHFNMDQRLLSFTFILWLYLYWQPERHEKQERFKCYMFCATISTTAQFSVCVRVVYVPKKTSWSSVLHFFTFFPLLLSSCCCSLSVCVTWLFYHFVHQFICFLRERY